MKEAPPIPARNVRGKKTRNPGYEPGNHWVICDICGCAIRAKDARFRWDNAVVCPDDWEPRHPQDFVYAKADKIIPDEPIRPEVDNVALSSSFVESSSNITTSIISPKITTNLTLTTNSVSFPNLQVPEFNGLIVIDGARIAYGDIGEILINSSIPSPSNAWRRLAYSPSLRRVIATGATNIGSIMYSDDFGLNWTVVTSDVSSGENSGKNSNSGGVAWSSEREEFIMICGGGFAQSDDGITWNYTSWPPALLNSGFGLSWDKLIWAPVLSVYVAIYTQGSPHDKQIVTSFDGVVWTGRTETNSNQDYLSVAEGAGLIVTTSAPRHVHTSPDGINFTLLPLSEFVSGGFNVNIDDLVFSRFLNKFVGVGQFTFSLISSDGVNWEIYEDVLDTDSGGAYTMIVSDEVNNILIAISTRGEFSTSTDGINWTLTDDLNSPTWHDAIALQLY